MNIEHLSISRQSLYEECQQKYKFKYHLKMASPEPEKIYFAFGKAVHKTIEEYTKSKGKTPIEKIMKDVLSGEIELQPGQKAPQFDTEYKNKFNLHIKNFMRLTDKIGFDGEVEVPFQIDLDDEGRKLVGVIDRLIKKNDNVFIIDYKTSKVNGWRKNERTVVKDLQLQCYCYVATHKFGVSPKNVEAALCYLEDLKIVPVRFSEKTLTELPVKLLAAYKEIETLPPDKAYGNVGNHCTRCEYKTKCPFYSLT